MVELQFKSICRLNRLLVVALMVVTISLIGFQHSGLLEKTLFMGLLATHFTFLMANEFLLKMLKRLREAEFQTITYFSVILPVAVEVYIGVNYALTGSFWVYLLGAFSMLQALFLGQPKLSKILGGIHLGLLIVLLPLGYPHVISLSPAMLVIMAVGWGVCLYYYGIIVSRVVKSHASQVGKLQSMAATDALTGLTNRRQFNNRLHEEVSRARRHETPLSLALFDLDDFKRLNDFYGHPVGDRILKELGKLIRQNIRESDLPARYGGEEFAIILPETREVEADELLERLRLLVAQTVFCLPENPLTITISVGVAQLEPRQHTAFELVELADKALYEAKTQGKNRVVMGSALMPKVLLSKNSMKHLFEDPS